MNHSAFLQNFSFTQSVAFTISQKIYPTFITCLMVFNMLTVTLWAASWVDITSLNPKCCYNACADLRYCT
jgi:hypothetical protein